MDPPNDDNRLYQNGDCFTVPSRYKNGRIRSVTLDQSYTKKEIPTRNYLSFRRQKENIRLRENFMVPSSRLLSNKNEYKFSYNIFAPANKEYIMEFFRCRHQLTISGLGCRIRLSGNELIDGRDKERLFRVEAKNEKELLRCLKLLNMIFPHWRLWDNGKFDNELNLGDFITD